MARGGYGRGTGIALQQRRVVGAGQDREPAGAPRRPRVRHCWVQHAGGEWPGLVVQWRQDAGGWCALVSWVEEGDALRVEWVPAHRLRGAGRGETGS